VGALSSLRSPNRPPPSPAHPAIPARLAALRVRPHCAWVCTVCGFADRPPGGTSSVLRLLLPGSFFVGGVRGVGGFPVQAHTGSPMEVGGRATTSARSRRSPATRLQRQRMKKPLKHRSRTQVRTGKGCAVRQSLLAACGGRRTPCSGAERSRATPAQSHTIQLRQTASHGCHAQVPMRHA
jgi:hypothetical protein